MATFKARVEDYIGTITDTDALTHWLNEAQEVLIALVPVAKAMKYATELTDAGSGISISTARAFAAHKSNIPAIKGSYAMSGKYTDSDSLHYATTQSPVWYEYNNKAYVVPNGGTVLALSKSTLAYTDTTFTIPELEGALILYAAIRGAAMELNAAIETLDGLTISGITVPTAPSVPVFTYTDATGTTLSSTSISVSSSLPAYTKPVSAANFTNANTYIGTDEDLEKANVELNQQRQRLEQFQMDLYNELNEVNNEAKAYELELQEAIAQAQLTQQRLMDDASRTDNLELANRAKELEKQVAEYVQALQKHASEVQSYIAQGNVQGVAIQQQTAVVTHLAGLIAQLRGMYEHEIKTFMET